MTNLLAEKIMETAKALPFKEMLKRDQGTHTVMEAFGKLGHSFNYRVTCRAKHYPSADDGEWMYDMTWYVHKPEQGNEWFTSMPMVLESELRRGAKVGDAVEDDFHKLVQARADVRVWISTSPNNPRAHIENCKRQIQEFKGTQPGDSYIFAIYDWTTEKPLIEQFTAPPQST